MRARSALFAVALLAVVAGVVLAARVGGRTVVSTSDGALGGESPSTSAPYKLPHLEGHYEGVSDFVIGTPSCATVDTVLDAEFVVDSGEAWQFHNQYCGTITDGRFTASGTFTFTIPDGSTLSGTSQTTDVVLANNGGPVELTITNGKGRFDGAAGSCSLANTVRNFEFGHQEQSGSFQCDVDSPALAPPASTSTTSTSSPLPEPLPCRSDQLAVRLLGIQGASQHLVASYWIADSSPDPCLLDTSATVDLLDAQGTVLATMNSTKRSDVPTRLSASTVLPNDAIAPPGIAYINLWWTELDVAAGGFPCPQPTLRPAAVQFHIGRATITTDEVASGRFTIAICGEDRAAVGPAPI